MKINSYLAGRGQVDVDVPNKLVRELLVFLLTREHWKYNPEALHERMLHFRKRMLEQADYKQVAPKPPVATA